MRCLIIFITLSYLIAPSFVYCEELTTEKKEAIKELIEITGAMQIAELMSSTIIQQMATMIKRAKPDVDPKALDIVKQEVNAVLHEELVVKESFQNLFYPIYHKYLTLEETKELIKFYNTPLGRKTISVMPQMTQESMVAGQSWGISLAPRIQERVLNRFRQEGINMQ